MLAALIFAALAAASICQGVDQLLQVDRADAKCMESLQDRDWEPIRIGIHYIASHSRNDLFTPLAAHIMDHVLPTVGEFWTNSIQVRRLKEPLRVSRDCRRANGRCIGEAESLCQARNGPSLRIPEHLLDGQTLVESGPYGRIQERHVEPNEGEDVDLVILVSLEDSPQCGDINGGTIATAFSCRSDACGRPLMGAVNICPRAVDANSEASMSSLYTTITHELTHVFGFNSDTYTEMRHPNGESRIPASKRKSVLYSCMLDPSGKPRVHWDVSPSFRQPNSQSPPIRYIFPTGVVSAVNTRGLGDRCRCPIDESTTYTSADIEHCLTHKHECAFAITTPRVAAVTKTYFGCPSVAGAELQNQSRHATCEILDSHWKELLFGNEYMTSTIGGGTDFVSPITFAFLDDTGWYRMNYGMTSALFPGAMAGYKAGCGFAMDKCVKPSGALVKVHNTNKMFCSAKVSRARCSADGLTKVNCAVSATPKGVPRSYRYGINSASQIHDYCPVYRTLHNQFCRDESDQSNAFVTSSVEVRGPRSRCLDVTPAIGHEQGMCFGVQCFKDGTEYAVTVANRRGGGRMTLAERCSGTTRSIRFGNDRIKCLNPKIVCSQFDFPHIAGTPVVNPKGAVENMDSRIEAHIAADELAYSYNVPNASQLAVSGETTYRILLSAILIVIAHCF